MTRSIQALTTVKPDYRNQHKIITGQLTGYWSATDSCKCAIKYLASTEYGKTFYKLHTSYVTTFQLQIAHY